MTDIAAVLGAEADSLLQHRCAHVPESLVKVSGLQRLKSISNNSDRSPRVLAALQTLYGAGRLGGTGYLSLLPVDHGVAHTAGMVFAPNPIYLDPAAILQLAEQGGSSGLVSTYGVLGSDSQNASTEGPAGA